MLTPSDLGGFEIGMRGEMRVCTRSSPTSFEASGCSQWLQGWDEPSISTAKGAVVLILRHLPLQRGSVAQRVLVASFHPRAGLLPLAAAEICLCMIGLGPLQPRARAVIKARWK